MTEKLKPAILGFAIVLTGLALFRWWRGDGLDVFSLVVALAAVALLAWGRFQR